MIKNAINSTLSLVIHQLSPSLLAQFTCVFFHERAQSKLSDMDFNMTDLLGLLIVCFPGFRPISVDNVMLMKAFRFPLYLIAYDPIIFVLECPWHFLNVLYHYLIVLLSVIAIKYINVYLKSCFHLILMTWCLSILASSVSGQFAAVILFVVIVFKNFRNLGSFMCFSNSSILVQINSEIEIMKTLKVCFLLNIIVSKQMLKVVNFSRLTRLGCLQRNPSPLLWKYC